MTELETSVEETRAVPGTKAGQPTATLRAKGFWVLVGFFLFTGVTGVVISHERGILFDAVQRLAEVHAQKEQQVSLNLSVARAILVVNDNYHSPELEGAVRAVTLEIESVITGLSRLEAGFPQVGDDLRRLRRVFEDLTLHPSKAGVADARTNLHALVIDLDEISRLIDERQQRETRRYQSTFDRLTLEWSAFAVLGLVFLGGVIMLFVNRLTWDIVRVRQRALDIVDGYRDEPLPVTRHDELGELMRAVNSMQHALRHRESQLELSRQQQFHKDKMATVGSLAAAVAHEINNPLSAIIGVAQDIMDLREEHRCQERMQCCRPELILEQAQRVMHITRHISEFSMPQSPDPELVDLNMLVRSTTNFVSFDRRFRHLSLVQDLDADLPAVRAVPDHLTQVLMNLLINAADACHDLPAGSGRIVVSTRRAGEHVQVRVSDNGSGMDGPTLQRVFDEYFTTKPQGRGSGLGLFLCKSLIEGAGGDIGLASEAGVGTTATVILPVAEIETIA
jgi:signal transduction histidine kinase